MNINELKDYVNDQPIGKLEATISYVNELETRTGPYGDFTSQNIQITDVNGDKIYVELNNQKPISRHYNGRDISMESTSGMKGFGGVICNRYLSKTGEDKCKIKISKIGHVKIGGEPLNSLDAFPKKNSTGDGMTNTKRPTVSSKNYESWEKWWDQLKGKFKSEDVRWKAAFSFWHAGIDLPVTEEDIYKMEAKDLGGGQQATMDNVDDIPF